MLRSMRPIGVDEGPPSTAWRSALSAGFASGGSPAFVGHDPDAAINARHDPADQRTRERSWIGIVSPRRGFVDRVIRS